VRLRSSLRNVALALGVAGAASASASGMSGCESSTTDDERAAELPPFVAPEAALRRLTAAQYRRSVNTVFGDDVLILGRLPTDPVVAGSASVGASEATVSSLALEQYETAAYAIAEQIVAPGAIRSRVIECTPTRQGQRDDDCAREVLVARGSLLFRRPLVGDELERLVDVSGVAAETLDDFYEGLSFGIAGLLTSPHFIFRAEVGEVDPDDEAVLRYSNSQLATRLSYLFWNTTPDETLLAANLVDPVVLEAEAQRLLEDPRAREGVRAFFTEMLGLDGLDDLVKDPATYVHFDQQLGPSAREETLRVIEHVVFDAQADLRTLFTTRETFLNPKLASVYAVPAPVRKGFAAFELPADGPRAGLLTHASVLLLHSHAIATSPTLRGYFVRTTLLCEHIPPPPANLDTSVPEPSDSATTLRERISMHREAPSCNSCHQLMDPMGFGLESFDAIGRHRTLDTGAPVDPSGNVDGAAFSNAVELGERLRDDPRVSACLVRRIYEYATGAEAAPAAERELNRLAGAFANDGYQLQELLLAVALSDAFRTASKHRDVVDVSGPATANEDNDNVDGAEASP
jgi:hypothetical protein